MLMRSRVAAIALLALLSACGSSPPTRFYTLDPIPLQHGGAVSSGAPVQVGDVTIPAPLDRLSFVTQASPNRIDISDQDRWAAPLDGMIRRVLAANLASRLSSRRVLMPGDPTPAGPILTVMLNVRDFIGDASGNVRLDADWSVLDRNQHPLFTRQASITRKARSGQAGPIAAAMSDALAELSDRIAASIPARS
jgi:uncharacterized protein